MGWSFKWVSSFNTDFNFDFGVSFTAEQVKGTALYNYREQKHWDTETVGISVFYKDTDGQMYHTYSAHQRGVDLMNGAYNYIDLTPKGRDEGDQGPNPQAWVRRLDQYAD